MPPAWHASPEVATQTSDQSSSTVAEKGSETVPSLELPPWPTEPRGVADAAPVREQARSSLQKAGCPPIVFSVTEQETEIDRFLDGLSVSVAPMSAPRTQGTRKAEALLAHSPSEAASSSASPTPGSTKTPHAGHLQEKQEAQPA